MRGLTIPLLSVLTLAVVAAGMYLAPSNKEIALMQMNSADYAGAMKLYTSLHEQGDNSINVLVPLINLHLHYGDIEKAISLLETYVAENPKLVEGHRHLAELYKSSQRLHEYCAILEKIQELAPSVATLRELANNYDFLGLYQKEMKTLARLVAHKDYRPVEEDFIKLASYYRVNHQPVEASQTLLDYITQKKYEVDIYTASLATQLLLDNGEAKQAFDLASNFLKKHAIENEAIHLASLFQGQEQYENASDLLTPFLANMYRSPELLQMVVMLRQKQGKQREVYTMLVKEFSTGRLPEQLMTNLIDLSINYSDYGMTQELMKVMPVESLPEETLLRYVSYAYETSHPEIAEAIYNKLDKEYLSEMPLLAVILDVVAHDTPESMKALLAFPQDRIASSEERMIVADIYLTHNHGPEALALFEGLSMQDMMGRLDPLQYAELYIKAGDPDKGIKRLNDSYTKSPAEIKTRIDEALLLLAVGQGEADIVEQWLNAAVRRDINLYDDALALASRYQHGDIALLIAEKIYKDEPTAQNRIQLAEVLLQNHHYDDALAHLQTMAEYDASTRTMFLDAMADWIHQAGINKMPAPQRKSLEVYLNIALKSTDMSLAEKRNLAYLLLESGFRDKAETIFISLAGNQPYGSADVNELLWFWGENLHPAALTWVQARAARAPLNEKGGWFQYLNDMGHSEIVVSLVQKMDNVPLAVTDQYIAALVNMHDKNQLEQLLAQEITRETDPARLRKLAGATREEDIASLAETAWTKLYKLNPGDMEAAKELGLMMFSRKRYTEAQGYLEQYLKGKSVDSIRDYRISYAYAEILRRRQKEDDAQVYYARALADIKGNDLGASLDHAHLLYRNDRIDEAMALYQQLLEKNPKNKTVRADYAEMLIESRKFDEASLVLHE
jgi:predicted Zn-dependent protease